MSEVAYPSQCKPPPCFVAVWWSVTAFVKRQLNRRLGRRAKLLAFLTVFFGSTFFVVSEEPAGSKEKWTAPATETRKKNPVAVSESSIAAGQKIYLKRCLACHGKTGNGDGPDAADLGIHPAKLSDPAIVAEADGALFWKITVGKKPMPNYGSRLSPTERWNVINYLRTLAKR